MARKCRLCGDVPTERVRAAVEAASSLDFHFTLTARAVIATLLRAGVEMREQGSFRWAADATPGAEIDKLLSA